MRLTTYLREKQLSIAEFGRLVHATPAVVRSWIAGTRIPSRHNMKVIYRVTKGAVDANEFYGLRKPIPEEAAE